MDPKKFRAKKGPEAKIQADIIEFMRIREWFVAVTHGSIYQSGFPDLYCYHTKYGIRWVEVKNPTSYKFTVAQLETFPRFGPIWILTAATEYEYNKLFNRPNWYTYLKEWKNI